MLSDEEFHHWRDSYFSQFLEQTLCLQGQETVCVSQVIFSYHLWVHFCPKYGDRKFLSCVGNILTGYDTNRLLFPQCLLENYLMAGYCKRSSLAWYLSFYLAAGSQTTFAKISEVLRYGLKLKVTNWITVRTEKALQRFN
jgi:hypothetical protein